MKRLSRVGLALGLALALALTPATRAAADDASEAQLHHDLGMALFGQRRYAEALDHFLASNRLVPNRNVVLNIATVYRLLRRPRDAYNWLETYLREFELDETERRDGERARDELARRVAVVEVTSDPPGATIFIDRVELGAIGTTPRRVAVEEGPRTIVLRRDAHHEARVDVTASRGAPASVSAALAPVVGRLSVITVPPHAEIRAGPDSTLLGHSPLELELPIGALEITISHEGYVDERRELAIRSGEQTSVEIGLRADASRLAILSVEANPAGAEVLLEGEPLGGAPLTQDRLEPGRRRVELRAPGRDAWSGEVLLEAGAATRVRARLRDPGADAPEEIALAGYVLGGAMCALAVVLGALALDSRGAFFSDVNPTRAQYDGTHALGLAADVVGGLSALVLGATFVWDLATGPAPPSEATIVLER